MGEQNPTEILFVFVGQGADRLALVAFPEGGYGITRNGRPCAGMQWSASEIAQCMDALMKLSAEHAADHATFPPTLNL